MERYQIILAYDGTQFKGFQKQKSARTVQGVIEEALRALGWRSKSVLAAGRTDAGVHASGQVIAFDLQWTHSTSDLLRALNVNLPADVAVREVKLASKGFHPRYSAVARRYHYRLFCDDVRDPLRERYAWRLWPLVSLPSMQQAAKHLIGKHDFAAFGAPHQPDGSTVREIFQVSWDRAGSEWIFEIVGNAFLYHMVRRLVFFIVKIGQGQYDPEDMLACLRDRRPPEVHGLAPSHGLFLIEVIYPSMG